MTHLTWFGWTFIALSIIGQLSQIYTIGKDRQPITPGSVVVSLILSSLLVWGAIAVGTRA